MELRGKNKFMVEVEILNPIFNNFGQNIINVFYF
jgi:hypothetical protein